MSTSDLSAKLSPTVLRASAGSGKTYQLSSRFIRLLLLGESADRILATTFTRKAAGEIKGRVVERLVEAAKDEKKARQLGQDLGLAGIDADKVQICLKQLLQLQHRLNICTLDSFFSTIARSFSPQLGLGPDWQVQTPDQRRELLTTAALTLLRESPDFLTLFSQFQGNLNRRRVHDVLVKDLSELLALTFYTPAEAWDLQHAYQAPDEELLQQSIGEFSHVAPPLNESGSPNKHFATVQEKLVHAFSGRNSWEDSVIKAGGALIESLLTGNGTYYKKEIPAEWVKALRPVLDKLQSSLSNKLKERTKAMRVIAERIALFYEDARSQAGCLSFDDIKRLLHRSSALEGCAEMYFRIDTRIRHLLLDEFQDTSLVDWELLEPVAAEVLSHADGSHSFFCVGDTKQAIYAFRGGVAEIFDNLEQCWPQLTKERLEVSRRSSPVVLGLVNRMFSNLGGNEVLREFPGAAERWQQRFSAHTAYDKDLPGYVSISVIKKSGEEDTSSAGIRMACDAVLRLLDAHPGISIGVLVRTQKAVSHCLFELQQRKIQASGEGGTLLSESPLISTVLSYLWFADHPGDSVTHYHVASSPLAAALNLSIKDNFRKRARIARFVRSLFLDRGLRGGLTYLSHLLNDFCSARDKLKFQQLIKLSAGFRAAREVRLSEFVRHARMVRVPEPAASNVQVMTIHKAKGLEFDAVFLCDLDSAISGRARDKMVSCYKESPLQVPVRICARPTKKMRSLIPELLPSYNQEKEESVVDNLSLLYVALTRARNALHIFLDPGAAGSSVGKLIYYAVTDKAPATVSSAKRKAGDKSKQQKSEEIYTDQEYGDPLWYEQLAEPESTQNTIYLPSGIKFRESTEISERQFQRLRPSEAEPAAWALQLNEPSRTARNRGILVHAMLEQLEWIDGFAPHAVRESRKVQSVLRLYRIPEEEVPPADRMLRDFLQNEQIRKLFSRTFYAAWQADMLQVCNERRFSCLLPEGLLIGTIDRLVLGSKGGRVVRADITDYKTGALPLNGDKVHLKQLESYRRAVCVQYSLRPEDVSSRVVYLQTADIKQI